MSTDTTQSTLAILATATRELQNDVLSIYFVASESGADANAVQEALRKKLADALAIVKPLLKEGEVETETGGFSVHPRYDKKSLIIGYEGSTVLTVSGTDTVTISELASKLTTMVVSGTSNSLSRKRRQSIEKELTAEAIKSFREKANDAAAAFGFPEWLPGSIKVYVLGNGYNRPIRAMAASMEAKGGSATPLEVESGKTEIGISVDGTIILDTEAKLKTAERSKS